MFGQPEKTAYLFHMKPRLNKNIIAEIENLETLRETGGIQRRAVLCFWTARPNSITSEKPG
jgi:hypothetical protein